jgi:hypothetical protein
MHLADVAPTIGLFVSTDGGVTWSRKNTFSHDQYSALTPSLALANGNLHLAYVVDPDGLKYVSGTLSAAPATWQTKSEPAPTDVYYARASVTISLALDSNGTPGIVWWADDLNVSYNEVLLFWKPTAGGAPLRVMDSQAQQSDQLASKLVFSGLNPRVLVYVQRKDGDFGVGLHTARSDNGGATWNTPVLIPADGDSSTDYPFDLAIDSLGRGAAAFGQNSSSGDAVCGNPKVSRTSDFVTFKTCDVIGDRKVTVGT